MESIVNVNFLLLYQNIYFYILQDDPKDNMGGDA